MGRYDLPAQYQTQASAGGLGGEERSEELRHIARVHTATAVANFDAQELLTAALGAQAELGLHPSPQSDGPGRANRLGGVAHQVEKGALERGGVGTNLGQ